MEKNYTGVHYDRDRKKWKVSLRVKGVLYVDTYTETDVQGAKLRDLAIIKNDLKRPLQVLKPTKKQIIGKGKNFVQEYEANAKHINKSINDKFCRENLERGTNKTPKKKKRKK